MRLTRMELGNWKNFVRADARLASRVFIIGGNGVGKSNLLDAFRFLHDIAKDGGGLRNALELRGGIGRIRSLFARGNPTVKICVEVDKDSDDEEASGMNGQPPRWRYELALKQENTGKRRTLVCHERVEEDGREILIRPNPDEEKDTDRLTQTALEQTAANRDFRELADFFQSFRYLHMVPQLVRHAPEFQGRILPDDPFGQNLMNSIAKLSKKKQQSQLHRIGEALHNIMPQIDPVLEFERDKGSGKPHLQVRHKNWRPRSVRQNEEQLSDGALRLIGLIWALLEGRDVIMLEEPEISFNEGLVRRLPGMFARAVLSRKKRESVSQVILTTHSAALLEEQGIGGHEVLLLTQGDHVPHSLLPGGDQLKTRSKHGTGILRVCDSPEMAAALQQDESASIGDVALRYCQTSGGVPL